MVNRALYLKYSSSQNYYYTKEINEFMEESNQKPKIVKFKDQVQFEEQEEYFISSITLIKLFKVPHRNVPADRARQEV